MLGQTFPVDKEVKGYDQDSRQDIVAIMDFVPPTQSTSPPAQGTSPLMQGIKPLMPGTQFSSLMQSSPPMQGTQGASSPTHSCSPLTQGTHLSSLTPNWGRQFRYTYDRIIVKRTSSPLVIIILCNVPIKANCAVSAVSTATATAKASSSFTTEFSATQLFVAVQTTCISKFCYILPLIWHLEN